MNQLNTPPVVSGARSFGGHSHEFRKDEQLVRRGYAEHGPVFTILLGRVRVAVLVGPAYHRVFFHETPGRLSTEQVYQHFVPLFGEISLFTNPALQASQEAVLYAPFTKERRELQARIILEETTAWMAGLGEKGDCELVHEVEGLIQRLTGKILFGRDFHALAGERLWPLFKKMYEKGEIRKLPNGKSALHEVRAEMEAVLLPFLKDKRATLPGPEFYLHDLLTLVQDSGEGLSDQAVMDWMIMYLYAGHEAPIGQTVWTIVELLRNPGPFGEVMAELERHFPPGLVPDPQLLSRLPFTRWAVEESCRMRPCVDLIMRHVLTELKVGEYRIPAGWLLMLAPDIAHYLPEVFPEPDRFHPARFAPDAPEAPHPKHSRVLFSGGKHRCPGMHLAKMEAGLITALLLRDFELTLLSDTIGVDRSEGGSKPTPVRVAYKKKRP